MTPADIGVVQMDGKIPNLAIMKIAAYHQSIGDNVEWWNGPLFPYNKVYASKIFQFTDDQLPDYVIRGGTGYDLKPLPTHIDSMRHDGGWFLYPKYTSHLGFSERGCRLSCSFCVVPEKEGKPKFEATIESLLTNPNGEDRLTLLDDDFLGHPQGNDVFEELIDRKLRVCFCQGLNIRTITEQQAQLLAKVKFWNTHFTNRQVTFAWDNPADEKSVMRGLRRCVDAGIKPYKMQFFILIGYHSTEDEDMHRVMKLKELGADPFVMAYDRTNYYQRKFQRWVNHRAIFKSVKWEDYKHG